MSPRSSAVSGEGLVVPAEVVVGHDVVGLARSLDVPRKVLRVRTWR